MKIAMIGTGRVGTVLGTRWAEAGHEVYFGSRRSDDEDVQALNRLDRVEVCTPSEAAAKADAIVLAVPWGATEAVIRDLGDVSGKVVIDCTNPLGPNFTMDLSGPSGGEQVASWAKGASVVKAFNTTGSGNMEHPVIQGQALAMLVCGDDRDANKLVLELASQLGFDAIDAGPLSKAKYLEALAYVWISQAFAQQWGPDFGFAVLRR